MSHSLKELKFWLLEILFRREGGSVTQMPVIDEQDGQNLLAMIKEHRLGPLLHWRLTRERPELPVPQFIRESCAQAFKAGTMRALMMQRELLQVHRILESAGIPHVALKGAWLAFQAYPQPGLRPLRDLDILVPEAQVFHAFEALLAGGCARLKKYDGSPEAFAEHSKHMPPLRSPSGQVTVELHLRLYPPDKLGEDSIDLSGDEGFWQHLIEADLAGARIPYMPPTELLLHLIVHAVYDHQFTNGPLLMSDLGYLLETSDIDWPRFWELAQRGGHERGAVLALRLLERHWGKLAIQWPASGAGDREVHPILLEDAAELMLRDFAARSDVILGHGVDSQRGWHNKLEYLLSKVFPAKSRIAAMYPVSAQSPWIYAWYPARWWRLLTQRVPAFLQARKNPQLRVEMSQLAALNRWLG